MDAAQTFWVFLFGGLGSAARFGVATFVGARVESGFPWGTLTVNLVGSALLGALVYAATASDAISPALRVALAAGFLGGFTTYSAFSQETLALFQRGDAATALAYVALTVLGCLAACAAGQTAARSFL